MEITPVETTSQRVDRKFTPETTKEVSPTITRQVEDNDSRSKQGVTISTIYETPTSSSMVEKETQESGTATKENTVESYPIKTSVEKETPTSESTYKDNTDDNSAEKNTHSHNNVIQNVIFALGTALATIGIASWFGYFIAKFM